MVKSADVLKTALANGGNIVLAANIAMTESIAISNTNFTLNGNGYQINDIRGRLIKEVKSDLKFEEGNLLNPSEALDMFHFRNWFAGIKRGEKLNSNIVDACISTQLVQYGNIAQRTGQQRGPRGDRRPCGWKHPRWAGRRR